MLCTLEAVCWSEHKRGMMEADRKARGNGEKKKEDKESTCSMAAGQETDRKRRKEEEDSGAPAMGVTGRKRKREEDGFSPGSEAADLETDRKRTKKEDDESAPKSQRTNEKEESGKSIESIQMHGFPDLDSGASSLDSTVTIHHLPDLMLLETFAKLDTKSKVCVARVCKRWRDLVYSPALWKHTSAHLDVDSLTSADLDSLKRRDICIVIVTKCLHKGNLTKLIGALSSLETLDVSCIELTGQGLAEVFAETRPSLRNLWLKLHMTDTAVFSHIAEHLPNLRYLGVESHYCSEGLLSNISILGNLQELWFHCSNRVVFHHISYQFGEMSHLRELTIEGMAMTNKDLQYLIHTFPNLQNFDGTLHRDVTAAGIQQLALLKNLQTLQLVDENYPDPPGIQFKRLENVRALIMSAYIGDEELKALAHWPKLEELEISCSDITEDGWRALGRGFRRLKSLWLKYFDCSEGTAAEHLGLLPALRKIVFNCESTCHLPMESLCRSLNHVEMMSIRNATTMTDDDVKEIAKMENLRDLELDSCSVGDAGLKHLADSKAPLKKLSVLCDNNVGEGCLHIAQQKKTLQILEFSACVQEEVLLEIMKELPHLRELTTPLGSQVKQKLKHMYPSLKVHM